MKYIIYFSVLGGNAEFSKRLKEDRKYLSKGSSGDNRRTRSRKFRIQSMHYNVSLTLNMNCNIDTKTHSVHNRKSVVYEIVFNIKERIENIFLS